MEPSGSKEAHQSKSGTAGGINGAPVDKPDYLYLHHKRYMPNDASKWNVRACKENSIART